MSNLVSGFPQHGTERSSTGKCAVNLLLAAVRRGGLEALPSSAFHSYARYLGLDPETEADLLWIAELAAIAPVPAGWIEQHDANGLLFYHHVEQERSVWTHPLKEEHCVVHQLITSSRNRMDTAMSVGLGGLRCKLWQLETECAEAEVGWSEHRGEDGKIFFFHRSDRMTSWTDPRLAVRHRLLLCRRAVWCVLGCSDAPGDEALAMEVEPDMPAWLKRYEEDGRWIEPNRSFGPFSMDAATECPVCYDPLCTSRPSALVSADGKRICGHYFCLACARRLQSGCPLCRAQAASGGRCRATPLPDIRKRPLQWFAMVDSDRDGILQQQEIVRALEASLPVDADCLRRSLESTHGFVKEVVGTSNSMQEDTNCLGHSRSRRHTEVCGINLDAFLTEGGVLEQIVQHFGRLQPTLRAGSAPVLSRDGLDKWFDFWDASADGFMSSADLLRALTTTNPADVTERRRISEIRSTIEDYFSTRTHQDERRISREAFLRKPNGLGEMLLRILLPTCLEHDAAVEVSPSRPSSSRACPRNLQANRGRVYRNRTGNGGFEEKFPSLRSIRKRQT
eukprot:TRINITY_DN31941_c0_g1_i1.p1 TRINITY_DN31941_c0_g1~~TRINITY_DN31941_c0_g1_i1.p1  ORF type:complete len:582 (-),score=66.17 TRINITY_DN31941_c0_g1_i1:1162-2856(-)